MNVKSPQFFLIAAVAAIIISASYYFYLSDRGVPVIDLEEQATTEQAVAVSTIKKILAIHSYNRDFDWVVKLERGFIDALTENGFSEGRDYEFQAFYMDTKVTYTQPEQILSRSIQAQQQIENYRPDLVLVSDDNALTYVAVPYLVSRQMAGPAYVFVGINSDPSRFTLAVENLERPGKGMTGALERMPILQGLALAKRLFPAARSAVILADKSESSDFALEEIRSLLLRNRTGIEVRRIMQSGTFGEWKEAVSSAQNNDDLIIIVTYHQLRDEEGKIVPAKEVVRWTTENSKLPELGTLQFHAEDGFLMAIGVSAYRTGKYGGGLAARILSGENPGEISIIDPEKADISFNIKRANQLGIQIPIDLLGLAAKIFPENMTEGKE